MEVAKGMNPGSETTQEQNADKVDLSKDPEIPEDAKAEIIADEKMVGSEDAPKTVSKEAEKSLDAIQR